MFVQLVEKDLVDTVSLHLPLNPVQRNEGLKMDKDAQERIGDIVGRIMADENAYHSSGHYYEAEVLGVDWINEILQTLKELGYCKLPKDKPPLLSDEKMSNVGFDMGSPFGVVDRYTVCKAIAQAQREADIKHYGD